MSKVGFKMISDWVRKHDAAVAEHKAAMAAGAKLNSYLVRYESDHGRTACQVVKAANETAASVDFNTATCYQYDIISIEKRSY
jgi:hypothetical protein